MRWKYYFYDLTISQVAMSVIPLHVLTCNVMEEEIRIEDFEECLQNDSWFKPHGDWNICMCIFCILSEVLKSVPMFTPLGRGSKWSCAIPYTKFLMSGVWRGRGVRLTFQLLMLSPNLLKSQISLCLVGEGDIGQLSNFWCWIQIC